MDLPVNHPSSQSDCILVCEESSSIKAKLAEILDASKHIHLVEVSSIKGVKEALLTYQPHLIIIGNSIQDDTNSALLQCIKNSPRAYRVPILALPKNRDTLSDDNHGITDYINLLESPEKLRQSIHNILETYRYFFQESESIEWLKDMEVLVAEDSTTFTNLYKYTLSTLGIKARFFKNGQLAWEHLCSCTTPPDLIVSDIIMPEMSGMELVRHIRSKRLFDTVPIIVSSAINELDQLNAIFDLGANDYFTKPFHADVFILRLKAHLKTHKLLMTQQKLQNELCQSNDDLDKSLTEQKITNNVLRETLAQLQETQDKLIESEKMAALGGLVTGIAHEINTPLGIGITGISHMEGLVRDVVKQSYNRTLTTSTFNDFCIDSQKDIDIIQTNLQNAAKLVNNFKKVSVTQSSGSFEELNLKTCLQEAILSLEANLSEFKHDIILHCADDIVIKNYPNAFNTIINNLISNSIVHGFVNMEKGKIGINASLNQGIITIEYHDNGIGMNAHVLEHIFDPFFTNKRGKGSVGLGAHIVYNLVVQRLKGDIQCSSKLGKGSTFVLQIPL